MSTALVLAIMGFVFIVVGLGVCITDVFKRREPSLSDTYFIGAVLMVAGVLIVAL